MSSYRVGYIVGNIKGRDHQYWPTVLRSELKTILMGEGLTADEAERVMDRAAPVGVDLATIMQIMWRVREWRVDESSFTYAGFQFYPDVPWSLTGTLPEIRLKPERHLNPGDDDTPRDVTDERDLLGPPTDHPLPFLFSTDKTLRNRGIAGRPASPLVVTADPPSGYSLSGTYSIDIGGYVIFDPVTKLFYPQMNFAGTVYEVPGPADVATASFYLLPVTPIAPPDSTPLHATAGDVQIGTLTIINPTIGGDDIEVPIGAFGTHGTSFPEGEGEVDLTMTPVAWWPYKNSLGEAVYNVATGAQVHDPFA